MDELRSPFVAPPGGVMTDEVGVITGELELLTNYADDGAVTALVRYAGAEEWYHLRGASCRLHDARDHEALHQSLHGVLHRPTG
jgi:hypothetical protein